VNERAQAEMCGVLWLMFGKIEVELGNDECNGHILEHMAQAKIGS
jgi:hypothetical protein